MKLGERYDLWGLAFTGMSGEGCCWWWPILRRSACAGAHAQFKYPVAFYTYILASKRNGTLYTGMTDDLSKRVWQHRTKQLKGFTAKYNVTLLVWYEAYPTREAAFIRERRIKEWKRAWKIQLIEEHNPTWRDLYRDMNW